MNEEIKEKIRLLAGCTFLPGSYNKRFAASLAAMAAKDPPIELTTKQATNLDRLFHMHRRQIPNHDRLCPVCRRTK